MKKLFYQSFKVVLATVLGIFIAEVLKLHYSTTAGVIAMLNLLDTRKSTMLVGIKRLIAASGAVILAILLFNALGHELWVLAVFLMIFVPLLAYLKSSEALAVSTVLVTHIYSINTTQPWIMVNELALLVIGVTVAWVLNLHVLNVEKDVRALQLETEAQIKEILRKMSLQLLNQCTVKVQEQKLKVLDGLITEGMKKAIHYNDNHLFKDYSYYEHYFQMRRQQYYVLKHMQTHFALPFIAVEEAKVLSDYTAKIADELNEHNDAMSLMTQWHSMREDYRQRALPGTRDEFENRATLFQYMNDLAYLKKIKMVFVTEYGGFRYLE